VNVAGAIDGRMGSRDSIILQLCKRLEGKILRRDELLPMGCDLFISWRFKLIPNLQEHAANGVTLICLDLGYFDDTKFEKFSISVNGVHGLSIPVRAVADLPERDKPTLHPWRKGGSVVTLLAPGVTSKEQQTPGSTYPCDWLVEARKEAEAAYPSREVKTRWHPRKLPYGEAAPPSLAVCCEDTYLAVTYSSTAAVQMVVAGVPTVIYNKRCAASPVCSYQDMRPAYPAREAWLHDLSYRQYDMVDADELDRAAEYIVMAYQQSQADGYYAENLHNYGIRAPAPWNGHVAEIYGIRNDT
jgi:hypothetical protein